MTEIVVALEDERCNVTSLSLNSNCHVTANCLLNALRRPRCKLMTLSVEACFGQNRLCSVELAVVLKDHNCKLTRLSLAINAIGDADGVELAAALRHENCMLTSLDLSSNHVANATAKELATAICHENCKLKELVLDDNGIEDEGATQLATSLRHNNCKLELLDLRYNNITGRTSFLGDEEEMPGIAGLWHAVLSRPSASDGVADLTAAVSGRSLRLQPIKVRIDSQGESAREGRQIGRGEAPIALEAAESDWCARRTAFFEAARCLLLARKINTATNPDNNESTHEGRGTAASSLAVLPPELLEIVFQNLALL